MSEGRDEGVADLIVHDGVTFRYPSLDRPALAGIDLRIGRGEFVGIVGATGAGKSTFCQSLNGIVPQFYGGGFAGSVRVAGLDTTEIPTYRISAHVGMVLEDPEIQITSTSVENEVAFALENQGVPTEEIRARITQALAAVGLSGLERKHPANLSGGQKQRLAIAAAIALAPDLIVLDEPTSQLDPAASAEVFAILRRLNEGGITVIVASHATEELAENVRRVLLLENGRIAIDGPPQIVFSATRTLIMHDVRPPDITRSFEVLARHWPEAAPERSPVTIDEARGALPAFESRLASLGPSLQSIPATTPSVPALEARKLVHVYPDGTRALDGVDLTIEEASFTAIVGRNGTGKSTLVRHFLNLLRPTDGEILVSGERIVDLSVSALARRIGYIAQNAHQQIFCDSVCAEVGFALAMQKRPEAERRDAVDRALDAMGLAPAADRHPLSLSRGDRLRVVIAAVLALEPGILIFDEPTTGQDWRGSLAILDMLRALQGRGATVVVITHHLYLLPGYAERLVVMDGGRVARSGALPEVLYDGATLDAAGLVPPQTVRFAREVEALRPCRPLGPDDLERACAGAAGAAA